MNQLLLNSRATPSSQLPIVHFPASRLARLPKDVVVPPGTTPESMAELCVEHATMIGRLFTSIPDRMRRWRFLDRALAEHDDESEERELAIQRRNWYRTQVRADLLDIVLHESRADLNWRFLEPDEREDMAVTFAWNCDPERESLIGLIFQSGQSWVGRCLDANFDLKATVGHIPDLSRGVPYRYDLAEYIHRGWLDGNVGQDPEGKWKKAELRREAIVSSARAKWST